MTRKASGSLRLCRGTRRDTATRLLESRDERTAPAKDCSGKRRRKVELEWIERRRCENLRLSPPRRLRGEFRTCPMTRDEFLRLAYQKG